MQDPRPQEIPPVPVPSDSDGTGGGSSCLPRRLHYWRGCPALPRLINKIIPSLPPPVAGFRRAFLAPAQAQAHVRERERAKGEQLDPTNRSNEYQ
jgi:hypothetical protein